MDARRVFVTQLLRYHPLDPAPGAGGAEFCPEPDRVSASAAVTMDSSPTRTFVTIQACRAVAALLVVCFHSGGNLAAAKYFGAVAAPVEHAFSFGDCGVAFFFVLSGFIVTLVHRRDFNAPARLRAYVRKRVLRVYPTYLLLFCVAYAAASASPTLRASLPHDAPTLIKSLALLPQDPAVVGGSGAPVIVVAWSMQYEIAFYVVIALAVVGRIPLGAALLLYALNYLANVMYGALAFPSWFFASNLTLLFGLGAVIAYAADAGIQVARPGLIAMIAIAGFFALSAIELTFGKDAGGIDHRLGYGLISALLVFGLVRFERSHPTVPAGRAVVVLGDASYALYLIHFPLIAVLSKAAVVVLPRTIVGVMTAFAFLVVSCVLASVAFHLWIERPLIAHLTAWTRPRIDAAAGGH